ncbi:MAG: hypothetical protein DRR06_19040 [Gammaproteobacteria bacterium]|nr:MAG: hypothetical protein DRR06_19040 [Gammaproteobacteria bacterium]
MDQHGILNKLVSILDQASVAVLATAEKEGQPTIRWMVPAVLKGRPKSLFALTSPEMGKYISEKCFPEVTWMVQTVALDKVITLKGKMNVIDNPSLKMEVLSIIGKKLHNFWKMDNKAKEFVVLETVLETGSYYVPLKALTERVTFE